jgi:hypothetical protein
MQFRKILSHLELIKIGKRKATQNINNVCMLKSDIDL